jgi:hypothetical protein
VARARPSLLRGWRKALQARRQSGLLGRRSFQELQYVFVEVEGDGCFQGLEPFVPQLLVGLCESSLGVKRLKRERGWDGRVDGGDPVCDQASQSSRCGRQSEELWTCTHVTPLPGEYQRVADHAQAVAAVPAGRGTAGLAEPGVLGKLLCADGLAGIEVDQIGTVFLPSCVATSRQSSMEHHLFTDGVEPTM